MTRLSTVLDTSSRSNLARKLADRVIKAVRDAGLSAVVVSGNREVAMWAHEHELSLCTDPGAGLSVAAAAGVAYVGASPWIAIHADLPLITAGAVAEAAAASVDSIVLAPSQDGGTTVIAGRGPFPFTYGVDSFERHLASAPDARVIVSPMLVIDIDTPRHLQAFPDITGSL